MTTVAIIGAGIVGRTAARQLAASGCVEKLILGARKPQRLHGFVRQLIDIDVEVVAPGPLPKADLTLLSLPTGGHADLAEEALGHGSHVISISESPKDVEESVSYTHLTLPTKRIV